MLKETGNYHIITELQVLVFLQKKKKTKEDSCSSLPWRFEQYIGQYKTQILIMAFFLSASILRL